MASQIRVPNAEDLVKMYLAGGANVDVPAISKGVVQGVDLGNSIENNKLKQQKDTLDIQKEIQALKDKRDQDVKNQALSQAIGRKSKPAAIIDGQNVMPSDVKGLPATINNGIETAAAAAFPKEAAQGFFKQEVNAAKPNAGGKRYQQGTLEVDGKILAATYDTQTGQYLDAGTMQPIVGSVLRGFKPDERPDVSGTMQRVLPSGDMNSIGQPGQFAQRPSDETVKQFGDFNTLKSQLQTVKDTYDPKFVGPIASRVGSAEQVTGIGATPQRAKFYANLNSIRNQLIYLRSGKQINENEYTRLLSEMPDEHTSPVDFETKLNNFQGVFDQIVGNRQKAFGEAGYKTFSTNPSATPPQPVTAQPTDIGAVLRQILPKRK